MTARRKVSIPGPGHGRFVWGPARFWEGQVHLGRRDAVRVLFANQGVEFRDVLPARLSEVCDVIRRHREEASHRVLMVLREYHAGVGSWYMIYTPAEVRARAGLRFVQVEEDGRVEPVFGDGGMFEHQEVVVSVGPDDLLGEVEVPYL